MKCLRLINTLCSLRVEPQRSNLIRIKVLVPPHITPSTILNPVFAPFLLVQQIVNCFFTLSPHTLLFHVEAA